MAIETNSDVAAKVRGALAEKGKKQAAFAPVLNLSKMSINRRMRGETPFTPEELIIIGRELDMPVATFFGEVAA